MARVKLTQSSLARPNMPIYRLAAQIQNHIHFPTPDPLYVVIGTMLANMLKGNSVWLVLVGPASAGKTMVMNLIKSTDPKDKRVLTVDMVKGAGALLSGVSSKEVVKGSTGGLLREVGDRGLILMEDFTTMLNMQRDVLLETMGAFRKVYDGSWYRSIGSDGGRRIYWKGNVGLITACTYAIDGYHSVIGELGERWLYWKSEMTDGYGETKKSLKQTDPTGAMATMRGHVKEYLEQMGFYWSDEGLERREMSDPEIDRFYALGRFVAAARSVVQRDPYTKEITNVSQTEAPMRASTALSQLYLGLEAAGLSAKDCWRIIGKVAMDSMPNLRQKVIEMLLKRQCKQAEIKAALRVSPGTVRKVVEDLEIHNLIECVGVGRTGPDTGGYRVTDWAREMLRTGLGA